MGRIDEKKQEKKQQKKEESDLSSYLILGGIAVIVAGLFWFFATGGGTATASPWDGVTVLEDEEHPTVIGDGYTAEDAEEMVEVVYYTDYGCPVCAAFDQQFKDLFIADHVETGDVKFVVKPVSFTDGGIQGDAFNLGMAHYAVWEDSPSDWPQWHSQVFLNQEGHTGWASPDNIESMTEPVEGIDAAGVAASVEAGDHQQLVNEMNSQARAEGATSTPGFVVGDRVITGLEEDFEEQMASAIEAERERMQEEASEADDEDDEDDAEADGEDDAETAEADDDGETDDTEEGTDDADGDEEDDADGDEPA